MTRKRKPSPLTSFDPVAYIAAQKRADEQQARRDQFRANIRHILGVFVGRLILRPFGLRYTVDDRNRGLPWLTTSANLSADGQKQPLWIAFNRRSF